jgi:hypothetical protein
LSAPNENITIIIIVTSLFPPVKNDPNTPVVPLCVGLINNYYSDKFTRRTGSGGGDGI